MDLLDAVLTKYPGLRKRLGLSDKPMTDLRLEAREILGELTNPDTADLIMHGVSRKYGLGPLHLAQLAGVPVPNVDLSASLSLGRLLPAGPEYLRDLAYGKDGTEALQEMTVNAAGAAFAIPLSILQMLGDNHPDRWKTYERALPTFMKHAVKAYRYWTEGEDYGRTGESVVEFDKHNPVEFAEIIAAGAGFPPERLSREKQMRWNLVEHERFYNARRQIIKHDYIWHRWLHPDARMLEEAEKALQSFNASAPGRLRITKKELADYRKSRLGTIRRKESGKPTSRRMRREAKEVQRIWGAGNESRGKDLFQ